MNQDFLQPISEQIWKDKYRLTTPNPEIMNDEDVGDTWDRIAEACANSPITNGVTGQICSISGPSREHTELEFRSILEDFNFLPAGRITAGAGSGRNVTLFNCYVMGTVPDDISGIFDMLREAALTMQQGGGIGYDFSTLRPAGSPVKGVDADASGPLTFMDVWDAMCKTIMSAGYRRGAMMATMQCDHPDIEAFITAKQDKTRLRMFNMSVMCSDEFMRAVKADWIWDLKHVKPPAVNPIIVGQDSDGNTLYLHKSIRARDLWNLIMKSTYDYAEPGVLFIDVINQKNNLWYAEEILCTKPCGEQPLPPYGACLLGSINLATMIDNPFSGSTIYYDYIGKTSKIPVRIFDTIIDSSNFPLPQQKAEAILKRRMGIGITGTADMLFMLGRIYGTKEAANIVSEVMKTITISCYAESIQLAIKYGPCPITETNFQRDSLIQSGFMVNMPAHIKEDILKFGLRNALLTSIAPTGTISLFAGNVSSGIEPIFAGSYTRKVLEDDGVTKREELVEDYAVRLYSRMFADKAEHQSAFVSAQTLTPADHLKMLAAVSPWVDSSISKTINCPEDISFDNFKEIYLKAYDLGLKGCTTYRPNNVTGSVLSVESEEKPTYTVDPQDKDMIVVTEEGASLLLMHPITEPMERPKNLTGTTYKLKWDKRSFYVTMNDHIDDNGNVIPFEIFINSSEMASLQWTVALTRMISAIYRRGGNVEFVGEELKRISDPAGGFWSEKKFVPSFVALLGQCIVNHMKGIKDNQILSEVMDSETSEALVKGYDIPDLIQGERLPMPPHAQCSECFDFSMVVSGGCSTCTSCGHSKCD